MKLYEKSNRYKYYASLICTLLSSLFAVALQFYKGAVLDHALAGQFAQTFRYAMLLILFIGLEVGGYYFFLRFSDQYAIGCISALRQDIFDSILRRSYIVYRQHPQGEYIAKFMTDAETIRDRRFRMKPMLWEILFKIILASAALFRLDQRIAVLTLVLLTTPLYLPKLIEKRLQNAQSAYLNAIEDITTKVTDWLAGFEIIKNYAIEHQIRTRFRTANEDAMDKLRSDTRLGAISQLITTLLSYLSYYIVLVVAGWLVLEGDFSAGDFFIAIGMIDQLSWPLISLAGIIRQLIAVKPVCHAMEEFLQKHQEMAQDHIMTELRSEIRFCDVSFSYDGQMPVLSGFSLTICKGKKYLLTGPSGCGKTTAVNLLLQYYDADVGVIEIDGVPIQLYGNTHDLITVVRQEATLFRDTLRHNLTMYQDIPDSHLMEVLHSVDLARFMDTLDDPVGENGFNFSGGEKKRICLARALLRSTEVLILDEPLANLDPSTAKQIEDLILSIPEKTVIVVSHQFSEDKLHRFDSIIDMA